MNGMKGPTVLGWGREGGDLLFLSLLLAPTITLAGSALQLVQAGVANAGLAWWSMGLLSFGLGLMHVMVRLGVRF